MKKFFLMLLFLSMSFNTYAYSKSSAIKIVKKYQKIAKAALDELDTDKAKKNLLKAISLVESYKLTDKKFADIYISAGVLNLMIEDGGEAVSFFKKALKLDPDIIIPENFSSDDVDAAFKKAKESSEKTDETFTFDTVTYKIKYVVPKTHYNKKALNIKVKVDPLPPSGYDVQVMFISKDDNNNFESLNLTRSQDNEYVGAIPALSIPSKELKLYILMIDDDLNPVTMFGSESKPLKIKIVDSDTNLDTDLDLDEDSMGNSKHNKKRKVVKKKLNDNFPILGFKIEFGTGVGIAHGKPKYTSLNIDPGLAWSPAWVAPDLSFYITPQVMVGITGRVQVIEKAWNIALKGQALIYNTSNYKLFTDFGAGYGTVRYRVDVSNAYPEQGNDIIIHGDIFLFSGVTFIFMFNNNFGFSSSAKINLIVPDISILMDFGAGLYMEF